MDVDLAAYLESTQRRYLLRRSFLSHEDRVAFLIRFYAGTRSPNSSQRTITRRTVALAESMALLLLSESQVLLEHS